MVEYLIAACVVMYAILMFLAIGSYYYAFIQGRRPWRSDLQGKMPYTFPVLLGLGLMPLWPLVILIALLGMILFILLPGE